MQYRIGIDAGGTKVAYGLFDADHALVDRFQHATPITADGPAFCDLVIESLHRLLQKNNIGVDSLQGIGICMPSFILFDEGYVCMTSAMVNIRDFAMRDYLQERLNVPVVLDNDSNVAALAEHRYGAGRGRRHMIYMATSTGIDPQRRAVSGQLRLGGGERSYADHPRRGDRLRMPQLRLLYVVGIWPLHSAAHPPHGGGTPDQHGARSGA